MGLRGGGRQRLEYRGRQRHPARIVVLRLAKYGQSGAHITIGLLQPVKPPAPHTSREEKENGRVEVSVTLALAKKPDTLVFRKELSAPTGRRGLLCAPDRIPLDPVQLLNAVAKFAGQRAEVVQDSRDGTGL